MNIIFYIKSFKNIPDKPKLNPQYFLKRKHAAANTLFVPAALGVELGWGMVVSSCMEPFEIILVCIICIPSWTVKLLCKSTERLSAYKLCHSFIFLAEEQNWPWFSYLLLFSFGGTNRVTVFAHGYPKYFYGNESGLLIVIHYY